jgi:hypothetical protein
VIDTDFRLFCRQATDRQLCAIVEREYWGRIRDPDRQRDYEDALREAVERGLEVKEKR